MKLKSILAAGIICTPITLVVVSCGSSTNLFLESYAPEENGLNLVKITNETNGSIGGYKLTTVVPNVNYTLLQRGICGTKRVSWNNYPLLAISPDGTQLAYISIANKQENIMVRSAGSQGISTQRTFRNVAGGIYWGKDNRLYFGDSNHPNYYISSVDASHGSVMSQHTNGNVDDGYPVLSSDGNLLFFTRQQSGYGPSIWALNKQDGTLSSCARGFSPCLIPGTNDAFYCVRNTTDKKSEIWYVNYVNGQESIVLSDVNHSFTNPVLSPNGKWLLVVGNATSTISKKENLDIFVVRTDGTQLTQLTYHPETDCSPIWSRDGRSIYFISSRANEGQYYNIWRMNFDLDF